MVKFSSFLAAVSATMLLGCTTAKVLPITGNQQAELLAAINALRVKHQVQPVEWSVLLSVDSLFSYIPYACKRQNDEATDGFTYGLLAPNSQPTDGPADIIGEWARQEATMNITDEASLREAQNFVTTVWKQSKYVECAFALCLRPYLKLNKGIKYRAVVCQFAPSGARSYNNMEAFKVMVLPEVKVNDPNPPVGGPA